MAIQALSFIAGDAERLGGFLAATGVGPEQIRTVAREPGFLGGVLDFLLQDEALMMVFADAEGVPPTALAAARQRLDPTAEGR